MRGRQGFSVRPRKVAKSESPAGLPGRLFLLALALMGFPGCYTAPKPVIPSGPLPAIPESHIGLSVQVPISVAHEVFNGTVKSSRDFDPFFLQLEEGADNCGKGVSAGYHVERSPFTLTGTGSALSAATLLHYQIQARARKPCLLDLQPFIYGSCGMDSEWPRMTMTITGSFAGIDQHWNPKVGLSLENPTPESACNINLVNTDVADRVRGIIADQFHDELPDVQKALTTAMQLPERVRQGWSALFAPMEFGPSMWLTIRPQQVGYVNTEVSSDVISARLQISAQPEVILSEGSPPAAPISLPPPSSVQPSDGFSLALPIEGDYREMASQVKKSLKIEEGGKRYPPTDTQYLTVQDATVEADGNSILLCLEVSVNGFWGSRTTLYLVGTPSYDVRHNVVSFPDLDFTVESRNLLAEIADRLSQTTVRNELREQLKFDLGRVVEDARSRLHRVLNQKVGDVELKGTVGNLDLLAVYVSPKKSRFKTMMKASGTLTATVLQ